MEEKITFTEYMNTSLAYRKRLIKYCTSIHHEAKEIRLRLSIIDAFDTASQSDKSFRSEVYRWMIREKGYSTRKLMDLSRKVGFDFFNDSIDITNAICTLDSVQ